MIKNIIVIYLLLASSFVMAESSLRFESKEVKITRIDLQSQTIDFIDKTVRKTMKLDDEVIDFGYYESDVENKKLDSIVLNKKYFIRIAYNKYIDENKKEVSNTYVSFISTVPYDTLY